MSTQTFHPSKFLKSLELLSKVRTLFNPIESISNSNMNSLRESRRRRNIAMISQWFRNNRHEFDAAPKLVNESWSLLQPTIDGN
jgi:hypothetical protein